MEMKRLYVVKDGGGCRNDGMAMARRENGSQLASSFAAWRSGGGETIVCGRSREEGWSR